MEWGKGKDGEEVPIHGKFHLLFIVRNRRVDLLQLQPQFRVHVPSNRATYHPGAEIVRTVVRVAQHDGEIFRDVVKQDVQWMHRADDGFRIEDAVVEYVPLGLGVCEGEVAGVPRAEELERHFHQLFAGEFAAGEVVEDLFAVLGEEVLALGDSGFVVALELEPPVRF